MGFVLTKGGYKSHWPQVGNLVTWDRAHVTYFSPSSPHSVGGVHPVRMCCHFNDSFPEQGPAHTSACLRATAAARGPRKGRHGWALVTERRLLGPEQSLLLSAVCRGRASHKAGPADALGPRTAGRGA